MSLPSGLRPMLATAGAMPAGEDWTYEIKWDGVRSIAYVRAGGVRMESRNLKDFTPRYPELCSAEALPPSLAGREAILDGEIVGFDANGRVSFGALQQRMHLASATAVDRARRVLPVAYMVFDLLWLDGEDLCRLPLEARRDRLAELAPTSARWQVPPAVDGSEAGRALREASIAQGLEGIIAKRHGSPYEAGKRTRNWLKIKNRARQELVVGGWLPGEGTRRSTLGALLVGHQVEGGLDYSGRVGTGFSEKVLRSLLARLESLASDDPPFVEPPRLRAARWVRPELVVEVGFTEWTSGGTLRHPVFLGVREDVDPTSVVKEPPIGEN